MSTSIASSSASSASSLSGIQWDKRAAWREKVFTPWKKAGVALDHEQLYSDDLAHYIQEISSKKPRPRTAGQLKLLAPMVERLNSRLVQAKPGLIKPFDPVWTSGKGQHGCLERHWLAKPLSQLAMLTPDQRSYAEDDRIFSALADRELPIQTLVWMDRQPNLWQVSWAQEKRGAWICVYTPLDEAYKGQAIIACRGTASNPIAAGAFFSVINDLLPELGSQGLQNSWPELSHWLKNNQITEVEVGGKSLGGNISQMLLPLLENNGIQVKRLITFQSPGVCPGAHLATLHSNYASSPHEMEVIDYSYAQMKNYSSDYVPQAGGNHLAQTLISFPQVKARRFYISNEADVQPLPLLEKQGFFNAMKWNGLVPSHGLRMGLQPQISYAKEEKFSTPTSTTSTLIEKIRRAALWILVALTAGLFLLFLPKYSIYDYIQSHSPSKLPAKSADSLV